MSRDGRRAATTWRIAHCARRLADARGLDGFTMDDLAAEAEVSRRTLFNHFAGKVEAILGPPPAVPCEAMETFRCGGRSGELVVDLRDLADSVLEPDQVDREELALLRRVLRGNGKLLAVVHERLAALSEQLVEQVQLREGPGFGRARARVAVAVLGAVLDAALDAFLEDPDAGRAGGRTLAAHFDDCLQHARDLLA